MNYLKKILDLMEPHEKRRGVLLLCMVLIMALLDVLGVASILPLIAVLANPELIQVNPLLNELYVISGFNNTNKFLFAFGSAVFLLFIFSLGFKALTTYAQLRFALMREYSIGKRLVEGYMYQPYSWFLNRNSADLGKTILSEVAEVIGKSLMPTITLITQGTVAFCMLIMLLIIDVKLAIIIGITFGISYWLVFNATSGVLSKIGEDRYRTNQDRFTAVNEAFGAFKEVKISGLEEAYINRFTTPAHAFAYQHATAQVITQLPRFALEGIAFGGMILVVLYLIAQNGNFNAALPTISLYALAGYRLMPAFQQIYAAVTQIRFSGPALDSLHNDLMMLKPKNTLRKQDEVHLKEYISLENISYHYPNSKSKTLKNINFKIPAKSTVGFVGTTGSGKTTTVDLILGLLEAQEGTLKVDGQVITEKNRRAWQRCIGYVPQQIYLADDTVAANIALGVDPKKIDQFALERAAKIANLHNFVIAELPNQYQTVVGERGIRLSGGQRQRIGIARALYKFPQVLILDEATSALDNITEQAVMEAVYNLGHEITIILIAHRLSTVEACDTIFLFDNGSLSNKGTFNELKKMSDTFLGMTMTH
jgi:ABC-type multidrug transport system fused ATPase/permease subunit